MGVVLDFAALQMQILARGWLVYQMTSSPLALGLVTVGWGLPVLLFSLVGGAVVEISRDMFREKVAKSDPFIRGLLKILVNNIRKYQ